ncbi:MAG: alpha/beta hydrolase [Planctomycetes bacterium]|nr:alpha/beta hydrolase [Planctomycetota bacterium]
MPTANINGVRLYYEIHGKGNPLILVAGLASDSQSWQPVVEDLARHYRLILPDNRGVGRTTPANADTSICQMADDCIALIQHLDLSCVHMLGHSMGGLVAQDCAVRYPKSIGKLILAGTSASCSKRNKALLTDWAAMLESGMNPALWFRNIFYWIFSPRFFEDDEAVREALRFAVEYPYPQTEVAFRKQVEAIARFNCVEALPTISAKTLVLCGKEDLLFPPGECATLSQAIPNAKFHVIDNAAHSIHMENPAAFTDRVLHFLAGG